LIKKGECHDGQRKGNQLLIEIPHFLSIVEILIKPIKNDATYFIVYQLEVLIQALAELEAYIERKVSQIRAVEKRLRGRSNYNHRQLALHSHALRHPGARYSIKSHRISHNVAYATARHGRTCLPWRRTNC
jgi:hypothetical protein